MNILIVGCGRVGRRLVHVLERLGHDVSVLDEDAANLALLNELEPPFSGMAVAGVPIDGDVLRSGPRSADNGAAVRRRSALIIPVPRRGCNRYTFMLCSFAAPVL